MKNYVPTIGLVALLATLLVKSYFASDEVADLQTQLSTVETANQSAQKKNEQLQAIVTNLREENTQEVSGVARNELGMVSKNEIYVKYLDDTDAHPPAYDPTVKPKSAE